MEFRPPHAARTVPISISLSLAMMLATTTIGCGGKPVSNADSLKIGAYSVVREVFHDGLIPAFAKKWKAETGRDATFEESYNASGAQARSIGSGFDADVAALSHVGDMDLLVKAGKVAPDWKDGPYKGILTHSLVVIGHRAGNPKSIHDFADLAKPGVGVLYPDPKTSGGARWNINAIYGSALREARAKDAANPDLAAVRDRLRKVQSNVVNMDQSGRQSMASFSRTGTGDAVVTYENELLLRAKEGDAIPYVVPPATLLIESPIALVGPSIAKHGNEELAKAFLAFLTSAEGQRIFAEYGFRPVNPEAEDAVAGRPEPTEVFTTDDLGGWAALEEELYSSGGLWSTIAAEAVQNRGK
ncbi:sulfate ABC transporter substrate-binding protein [Planctomyces sp. SH-PL62]|uniref:sulfate ABC transporter substrate-binding protein n=1 Tax=Planctomyces sp. SH-PL62 TaxID=1636152 RepID=UPI00078DC41C|nr:sulfate ABC transporter substrate-binding protein [Planctomyces sp. SH-PL62]AMV35895.1 Sulfate-binding protein precursor [Planctomyces sp. SH-PL62]